MWIGLLGSVLDSVIKAGFAFFAGQMDKRNLIAQGQQIQAAATTAATEAAQAKIGQALADSPKTADQSLERLKNGY